jgi:hypothetical protein
MVARHSINQCPAQPQAVPTQANFVTVKEQESPIPMEISVPLPSPMATLTLLAYSKREEPDAPRTPNPFLPILNFGDPLNSINSLFANTTDNDMSQDSLPPLMEFWQGLAQ